VELANMKLSDIQFSEETIRIPSGKGRKPRIVPIQRTCREELQTYIRERGLLPIDHVWVTVQNTPLQRASIVKSVRTYCAQANIKGTRGSCHTFRHTMAKAYLLSGGDVFTLMHILGHTSIEMTRKYVDLFNDDIHKQHLKASPIEFVMMPDSPEASEGEDA
jgi:integrase/recombinase XerD